MWQNVSSSGITMPCHTFSWCNTTSKATCPGYVSCMQDVRWRLIPISSTAPRSPDVGWIVIMTSSSDQALVSSLHEPLRASRCSLGADPNIWVAFMGFVNGYIRSRWRFSLILTPSAGADKGPLTSVIWNIISRRLLFVIITSQDLIAANLLRSHWDSELLPSWVRWWMAWNCRHSHVDTRHN